MSQLTSDSINSFQEYFEYAKWISAFAERPIDFLQDFIEDINPVKAKAANDILNDRRYNAERFNICRNNFKRRLEQLGAEKKKSMMPTIRWMDKVYESFTDFKESSQ